MKFTPYTFALSDLVTVSGTLLLVALTLWFFAKAWCAWFDAPASDHLEDTAADPTFEETGVCCQLAKLPPGSILVEVDTAGVLTPPAQVFVHEYRWTGSRIEFVRMVPLHEFSFSIPAEVKLAPTEHEDARRARERFNATAQRLNLISNGNPIGRAVSEF